jgi:hypothetical protein
MVVRSPRWFSDEPGLSPFLTALEDVSRKATREGWCYRHVQAIIVSIDQYAEPLREIGSTSWTSRTALGGIERVATCRKRPQAVGINLS